MSEIVDALLAGKTVEASMTITGAELTAARLAEEARLAERDARQRRLLAALHRAAQTVRTDLECLEHSVSCNDGTILDPEDERQVYEGWAEVDEYAAILNENGINLNCEFDKQLPEDARLPADYWKGAT